MSKDKIEVSMNVYDIPIVIEELEKAEDEIKKLQQENQQLKKQKDDVIEYIKTNEILDTWGYYRPFKEFGYGKDLLRILGEIE